MKDQKIIDDVQHKEDAERKRILKLWETLFRFGNIWDDKYNYSSLCLSDKCRYDADGEMIYYSKYDFSMLRTDRKTKETKLIIGEYKNRIKLDANKFEKYKNEGILIELQKVNLKEYTQAGCVVWYLNEFNEGLFLADITNIESKNYPIRQIECRSNNTYFDKRWKDCNLIPFNDGKFFFRNPETGYLEF